MRPIGLGAARPYGLLPVSGAGACAARRPSTWPACAGTRARRTAGADVRAARACRRWAVTVSKRALRIVTASTLVAVLAVAITVVATPWWKSVASNTYVAYFANTNGLYTGDEVRILGVAVGTVEKIDPQPDAARAPFSVDSQYPVPSDVQAAILSPSLVSARA